MAYAMFAESPFFPPVVFLMTAIVFWCLNKFLRSYFSDPERSPHPLLKFAWVAIHDVPIYLLGAGLGIWLVRVRTSPPQEIGEVLNGLQFLALLSAGIIVCVRAVIFILTQQTQERKEPKEQRGTTLLTTLVEGTGLIFGIIIFLGAYGISIAPFVTAMGIGGMAVALGLQETLANIFAGLQLILSKQILVGDHIKLSSGEEGQVTDITWRYTSIYTATRNNVIVPNKTIASATLTNYDRPSKTLSIVVPVGVSYDSDLDEVERVTIETAERVIGYEEGKSDFPRPAVRFQKFNDSSIDFNVVISVPGYADQLLVKHEFIKALMSRYREEGIDIPFPIRNVKIDSVDKNINNF